MHCLLERPAARIACDRGPRISTSYIGQEFGWKRLADVKWEMLRQTRDDAELVLDNLHRYPDADVETLFALVCEINLFVDEHFEEPECLSAFFS